MDDWDHWNPDSSEVKTERIHLEKETAGKIISRGRGFSPFFSEQFDSKLGGRYPTNGHKNDLNNKKNSKLDYGERKDGNKHVKEPNQKGQDRKQKPKPKTIYIPDVPTEDDNEIFATGISSGMNFDKYDTIEVRVSGENPPKPISSFEEAGLISPLGDLIKKCNYSKPTPIQKHAIPIIMNGRDMMACAQTGSGKTAAFLIPIINRLLEERKQIEATEACQPQAVIVSPTRELTIQIFNEARKFSRGTGLKVAISYGGTAVFHQLQNVVKGCDILVATPGRLLDFLKRRKVIFSEIKFIVLDEGDRMLDFGFLPDIERVLTHPTMVSAPERQTLMFSATFPEEIQRLAGKFLDNYLFVAVGIVGSACSDVEQRFFSVPKLKKREKLIELLRENGSAKCLVFVEQKRTTDFIATLLCEKNFRATSIHGDREQREREEALKDLKTGRMDILVATSVAARGLDIKNIAHVINFDLPKTVDEYVHRIGRTGRVGNRGLATSFYDPKVDEPLAPDLVKILNQTGQPVPEFLKMKTSKSDFDGLDKFGGSDFRENAEFKNPIKSSEVYEDEIW